VTCEIYEQTSGIYGAPRVHAEPRLARGLRVGRKRVARLMRSAGLRGADGRRGGGVTPLEWTRCPPQRGTSS
jgi:putative transposase